MQYLLYTAAVAFFARLAIAQTVDPNSVPLSTRQAWCDSQISQCPLICLQEEGNSAATYSNTCDPVTLTYSCVCSNGLAPNASEYSQTLPYYICTQYNSNCQAACGNNNDCAAACVQDHPCGASDPTRVNTSTITTMPATSTTAGAAASTASDGVIYTGFGDGAAATASASSDGSGSSAATRIIVNIGQIYGLGVVAAGIFAGFSFML
ncbi:uncharacterized protein Z518_09435 [Rhinocladiella mackenziei CBS 650.93]|uniref:Rhinocladiella mackenziei CBS 650.93 unplaced genomic scaffold supercont1.7, whole genome shotgun sequence n=1 Tax=Rhinocladiella mackenziei CBS 650.93 TaxID=1442369 RepID=A0A0D2I798_9EURO|nr:uncharacterized protein Z518_09435 [Rhinocladiella mackenziei CBS 650.93]KIX01709.1 hypothetical protein Z518_09435 [Rhinocladiella mackenziei CBS 650.93]